jgi:hypothetical protein
MDDYLQVLHAAKSVLLIDYPGRVVPDSLARAGFSVVAHEGPGPLEYFAYDVTDGEIVKGPPGPAPESTDLVFSHRPIDELPPIVDEAKRIGASAVWTHSGFAEDGVRDPRGCWMSDDERAQARAVVESAGLLYIDHPFILDAVDELGLND